MQLLCILVPSTLLIFSYSIFVSQLFFSVLLTLSNCSASLFPQLFFSLLTHKQLFCILLSSNIFSLLTLSSCSASLFPHLFFSLLTLNNCSASFFTQLFFSVLTLSNCSASSFPQLFFFLFLLSNFSTSLIPQLFFSFFVPQSNFCASLSISSSCLF